MVARVAGKVAFITGAARGQGRAHAVRLAEEGADIIAVDNLCDVDTVPVPGASDEDMAETVGLVEKTGRRIVWRQVDVRDQHGLDDAVSTGVGELGRLDIVVANAGVLGARANVWDMDDALWQTTIDVNLTGVFRTVKASVPHLIRQDQGGSVIITSSAGGLKGVPNYGNYTASKHGVVGLARSLAMELADRFIRVNTIHPGNVDTRMIVNDTTFKVFAPDKDDPTKDDVRDAFVSTMMLPIPWVDPVDISNAVLWLASDESRYVTGTTFRVDGGMASK